MVERLQSDFEYQLYVIEQFVERHDNDLTDELRDVNKAIDALRQMSPNTMIRNALTMHATEYEEVVGAASDPTTKKNATIIARAFIAMSNMYVPHPLGRHFTSDGACISDAARSFFGESDGDSKE